MTRILVVLSGSDHWTLKDDTSAPDRLPGRGVRLAAQRVPHLSWEG
jgi:hypothetical protein